MAKARHWRDLHIASRHYGNQRTAHKARLPADRPYPRQQRHSAVYHQFARAVKQARHYVYITSEFFVPNPDFLQLLQEAHHRGVDVRVLVPEHSDIWPMDWVFVTYTPRYLKSGLRIFHYRKSALHGKTALVDDRWATVGHISFDAMLHGREASIITTDPHEVLQLKQQFLTDLKGSRELTWAQWRRVPLWKKIAGYGIRGLRAIV